MGGSEDLEGSGEPIFEALFRKWDFKWNMVEKSTCMFLVGGSRWVSGVE